MRFEDFVFPVEMSQFLPHRAPMLMVDFVTSLSHETIETTFEIKSDNIFLEGHFFNETGVIENAAQTCSGIVGWPHFEHNMDKEDYRIEGFISKIQKVDIYELPPVNAVIKTKGVLKSMYPLGDIYNCKMDCITSYEGKVIAHSIFTLIIKP